MTCDFTSFSTVFQSYQEDERLTFKEGYNGTCLQLRRFRLEQGSKSGRIGRETDT